MRSPREKMNKVKRVSYFIHCKKLCKCYSVTPPSITIRGKKEYLGLSQVEKRLQKRQAGIANRNHKTKTIISGVKIRKHLK
jgi:hypothetical protein